MRIAHCARAKTRFRLVADRAPVILWTARTDTRLDFVNAFSVEFSGVPLEQLLDEGWLRFIHPQDVEPSMSVYVPAFEARQTLHVRIPSPQSRRRVPMDAGVGHSEVRRRRQL